MQKHFNKIIIASIIIIAVIGGSFLVNNFLRAEGNTALPDFNSRIPQKGSEETALIKYFFFKQSDTTVDGKVIKNNDIIGIRVYKNPDFLSPLQWYRKNVPNPGNPSLMSVDGYEALRDGRSIYVSALFIDAAKFNQDPRPLLQSYLDNYIYLISYNEGASSETIEIFNRMIKNWKFNTNVDLTVEQKQKIKNDLRRLADIKHIKILLENYKQTHGYYPKLEAGTYIANHTVSTWPSWQYELGKELGSFLPLDPKNKLGQCKNPNDLKFDSITCWDKINKTYAGNIINGILQPVVNSFVYTYSSINNGQGYHLNYETEFGKGCNITQCFANDICHKVGTCYKDVILNTTKKQYCQLGEWVNHCGNNIINCGEVCDGNIQNYCDIKHGLQDWYAEKEQNCTSSCVWEAMADTSIVDCGGYCGDKIINGNEQCDDNSTTSVLTPSQAIDKDHQYGCLNCKLDSGWCGDEITQLNYDEECDDKTVHCNNVCKKQNQNPIVTLGEDQTTRNGVSVTINGSASDSDNDPLIYFWKIISKPQGSIASLSNNNTLNTSFTPDKAGEYELKLLAKDNFEGVGFDIIKIIIQTYCGDKIVQNPNGEGVVEECDGQNGLEGYHCVGAGVSQCDGSCKMACTNNGTLAKCGKGVAKFFGVVSNAMSTNNKISGANIEIKDLKNKLITSTTTDVNGNYIFENLAKSFSLTETLCGYKVTVSKDGFQLGEAEFNFEQNFEKNFALTPEGLKFGTKIILKWGAEPIDLDAHLEFEANNEMVHIYYGNKDAHNGVSLNVEDKNGNGPETITIDPFVAGSTYKYYVHNYSG
ncbi:MAG: hypothetical protein C0412_21385, partial [Flavobacterium sp.]|nr:hypothetical protein [Flavobacterium sp.]